MTEKALDDVKNTSAPNKRTGKTVAMQFKNKNRTRTAPYSMAPARPKKRKR